MIAGAIFLASSISWGAGVDCYLGRERYGSAILEKYPTYNDFLLRTPLTRPKLRTARLINEPFARGNSYRSGTFQRYLY